MEKEITVLIDALLAIQSGKRPDQETILRLRDEGLIELADVTNLQSVGREYIPTVLTAKGVRLLETGKLHVNKAQSSDSGKKRWDVFISHASEDKAEIAHDLAEALRKRGYAVWYDQFSLKLGDSLRESIDRGLAQSRYGVVILSKHFFAKRWPGRELNGLTAIEIGGENVILPIWHGVTHDEVLKFSPMLADKRAANTKDGLDSIVAAIEQVISPPITAEIEQQLQAAEETLQEYRCPHCKSPLSTRSSVQVSEDDDGLYEDFQCGYAHLDGYMRRPCPSDPKFPKPEDFEFTYQELLQESHWKWRCFANGKTREAQMLSLMPGLGRTKEEARDRVVATYRDYAKPWKG
jgi:hypothetical protein